MTGVVLAARVVLFAVFAVAGAAKLRSRDGTTLTLEEFGLPWRAARPGAVLLPLAELTAAALLLPDGTAVAGAVSAALLLSLFIVGISVNLARGRRPDCNCFGQIGSTPVGPATLVRNALLLGLATIVLAAGYGDAGATALGQAGRLDTATALAATALVVALTVLTLQVWLGLHLLRRHGRVLLRLDAIDGGWAPDREHGAHMPSQLPVGAPAPAFELEDASGKLVGLHELLDGGTPLAIVFVEPDCKPCRTLLPDLAARQLDRRGGHVAVVVTRGDPKAARKLLDEHEFPRALIDGDGALADAFRVFATPTAVAIGADGLIRSAPAAGPDAVRALLERLDDSPADGFELAIVHVGGSNGDGADAIAALGQPAPDLQLEDLNGAPIALRTAVAGQSHLLLFWSPSCGYCDQMLGAVRDLEARDDVPALLLIATGDREANRDQDLRSRTLMDHGFEGSGPALGVSGTPSALRLDAEGRIVSQLAVGADQILALAGVATEPVGLDG